MKDAPIGYAAIKQLAKEIGENVADLLALAPGNDPFYAGAPAHVRDAEWFATWFERLGFATASSVHLRGVHYRLISQREPVMLPSGTGFINTTTCWKHLSRASRMARHLELIRIEPFVDRRNPDPIILAQPAAEFAPEWLVDWDEWVLPEIAIPDFEPSLPELTVIGYEFDQSRQPYHLEIWCEKSSMDEFLLPICERHGINLITGKGFLSITSALALLNRAIKHGKPTRVLYLSDFDGAGDCMPTSIARQVEFQMYRLGVEVDIKLEPLILTKEQVLEYGLPSTPAKETDTRAAGFESRYGLQPTELDALQALYPGELARLVEEAIEPYRDPNLEDAWGNAGAEADEIAEEAQEWVVRGSRDELDDIQAEVQRIADRYRDKVAGIAAEMQKELEPYRQRLESVRHGMQSAIDSLDDVFDLPPEPEPSLDDPDDDDWLFDSNRTYLEQLAYYKARREQVEEITDDD